MKKQKPTIHQTYGHGALRTACGLKNVAPFRTARPGPRVTCKNCIRVEAKRRLRPY